jgi:membrane protease YdiL (CAAX protease family)
MNPVTRIIRAHPLVFFYVLACLFGWSLFIAAAMGAGISPDGNPLGPILAALIVAALMGRLELRSWGSRLVHFRTSPGWYVLAIAAPAGIILAAVLANHAYGAPLPTRSQLAGWTALPGQFLFTLILVGIGEEAGWMAFAAPRLLNRHGFITAWLILSAMRVFWHMPLMLSGMLPWVLGVGGNIAFQFLMIWMLTRSGRVWFLAAVWHGALNAVSGSFFFQMVQGDSRQRLGVLMALAYVLVAAAVFLFDHRRMPRARAAA